MLTKSDLENVAGEITWEIHGGAAVSEEANMMHAKGREASQRGDYDAALSYFEQAAQLAPDWPYPIYDAAFSYLLLKDFEKAHAFYRRVDEVAP